MPKLHDRQAIDAKDLGMIERIRSYGEAQAYGVCSWFGDKLNVKTASVQRSFIYVSCLTLGSPIVVYLIMAFVLDHKERIKRPFRRSRSIWEL